MKIKLTERQKELLKYAKRVKKLCCGKWYDEYYYCKKCNRLHRPICTEEGIDKFTKYYKHLGYKKTFWRL